MKHTNSLSSIHSLILPKKRFGHILKKRVSHTTNYTKKVSLASVANLVPAPSSQVKTYAQAAGGGRIRSTRNVDYTGDKVC